MRSLLLICFMAMLSGCGWVGSAEPEDPQLHTVALPYHEAAVSNMVLARSYMQEGRFELAKERLLIALSAARDDTLKQTLAVDLQAVDRMIRSRR